MTAALKNRTLSERQALSLWKSLRTHFVNAAKVIEAIIEQQAWIPLGYESFAEAWNAQMSDVTLATEVRPHVVYQMLAEGYDYDAVARSVKGVGHDRAESLDRQRRNGVPARDASMTVVREHLRKPPAPPSMLHIEIGTIAYKRYQKIADRLGTTVESIAAEAIKTKFKELAR